MRPTSKENKEHAINLTQWRQDVNTFFDETQGELQQIIDEFANSLFMTQSNETTLQADTRQHNRD